MITTESINERINKVRKRKEFTQKDFGERIGMKANSISDIEKGKNSVTEYVIKLVCSEFNVNEQWLRTGEGGDENMFLEPQKNDLVAKAALLLGEHDPIFEALVETYSKLNPVNRKAFVDFGLDFLKTLEKYTKS